MPAYKTPKQFPGAQHLPDLAQTLLQRFFPADELPTPAMAVGPPMKVPEESIETLGENVTRGLGGLWKSFAGGGSAGQTSEYLGDLVHNPQVRPLFDKFSKHLMDQSGGTYVGPDPGSYTEELSRLVRESPDMLRELLKRFAD